MLLPVVLAYGMVAFFVVGFCMGDTFGDDLWNWLRPEEEKEERDAT